MHAPTSRNEHNIITTTSSYFRSSDYTAAVLYVHVVLRDHSIQFDPCLRSSWRASLQQAVFCNQAGMRRESRTVFTIQYVGCKLISEERAEERRGARARGKRSCRVSFVRRRETQTDENERIDYWMNFFVFPAGFFGRRAGDCTPEDPVELARSGFTAGPIFVRFGGHHQPYCPDTPPPIPCS